MNEYFDAEFDTLPWDEIVARQARALPAFLARIVAGSTFYAERLAGVDADRIDSPSALATLPFVTKDDIRALQAAAAPEAPYGAHQGVPTSRIVETLSSSGTTGRPTFYALTAADRHAWTEVIANSFFTAGVRPSDTIVHTTSLAMAAGGWSYADALRRIGANVVWVGGFAPVRMIAAADQLHASAMLLTPSYATYLTERCEELIGKPPRDVGLRLMVGGGEPGMSQPEIRTRLREAWQLESVRETMGLTDVVASMWSECASGPGMHFVAGRIAIVELIDPDTGEVLRWEDGAVGEPVYTTFEREATPMVRFRSRDRIEVVATRCACGRTAPKMLCIGRTDDMLIYKAMNVFPTAIRDVVLAEAGDVVAAAIRIRKNSEQQVRFDDPIPVELEAREGLEPSRYAEVAARVEAAVRGKLQVRIAPEVHPPGSLPTQPYKNALTYVAKTATTAS